MSDISHLLKMMEKIMITKINVDQHFGKFEATGDERLYDGIISNFRRINHPHFSFVDNPYLTKAKKSILGAWILDMYNAHTILSKIKKNEVVIKVKEDDANAFITFKLKQKLNLEILDDFLDEMIKAQEKIDDYRIIVYAFNHIPTNGKHSKAFYDIVRELRNETSNSHSKRVLKLLYKYL